MKRLLVILEPRFVGSIYMVENGMCALLYFFRIHLVCVCVFVVYFFLF